MFNVNDAVADPLALSTTFTLKLEEPALLGVPLNTPAALSVKPAGTAPLETLQFAYGGVPPLAARVSE